MVITVANSEHYLILLIFLFLLSLPVPIRYLIRYLGFREKLHKIKSRNTVVTEYNAPINLPPAFFGTMLDNRLKIKELAATILELHIKNVLNIEYIEQTKSFQVRLLNTQTTNLLRHEQYIISVIQPHLINGVIEAKAIGDVFKIAQSSFIFVVEQDLQIAGYYMFNKDMNNLSPTTFYQKTITKGVVKGIIKPWNWPGFILSIIFPVYGIAWLILAILFYNRIGIYNYKTKEWENIWPNIEGYYNYLFEAEKQPRDYDLDKNPELFKVSVHDPYLLSAQIENKWMNIFGLMTEIGAGSDKDYKAG